MAYFIYVVFVLVFVEEALRAGDPLDAGIHASGGPTVRGEERSTHAVC